LRVLYEVDCKYYSYTRLIPRRNRNIPCYCNKICVVIERVVPWYWLRPPVHPLHKYKPNFPEYSLVSHFLVLILLSCCFPLSLVWFLFSPSAASLVPQMPDQENGCSPEQNDGTAHHQDHHQPRHGLRPAPIALFSFLDKFDIAYIDVEFMEKTVLFVFAVARQCWVFPVCSGQSPASHVRNPERVSTLGTKSWLVHIVLVHY